MMNKIVKLFIANLLLATSVLAFDMSTISSWNIPEGEIVQVKIGDNVIWPVIPYVKDGLVAMWDGEWNTGIGLHSDSTTVWKDLVGNRDATLTGSNYWSDNCWNVYSVSNNGLASWSSINLPESQTWEFVVYPFGWLGFNGGSRYITLGGFQPRLMATNNISMYSSYGTTFSSIITNFNAFSLHVHTITHEKDSTNINYWIDGKLDYTQKMHLIMQQIVLMDFLQIIHN